MIELVAPAKLTWFLEITGVRENGYHELRSEMVTLEFADRLTVDPEGDYLRLAVESPGVPLDASNLVARALSLVGRRAGVTLEKVIPTGGGLGGGSADAAAILRWAGGVSARDALALGGDVPFCQLGGRAMVEGVGERLTPLAFVRRDVTLMMPDFSVDTRQCYEAFDELVAGGARPSGRNHLERAAALVAPRLARTLAWLRAEYGAEVELCGSGSTMFLEGHLDSGVNHWGVTGPEGTVRFRQTTTTPT
jgi:4-diphosphocytidyl-2-C-methyl-D-erythritol kinase